MQYLGPYGEQDSGEEHGPPSVVGQPGMPEPAPRPKGPKLKFTSEDDQLLVELKETKNLTWKQIADFFPGRSSGTLQVRYCTKLKAKTTIWTDDMVQKLRAAIEEYDNDRWRIISGKVGNGFSATACKEKAAELDGDGDDEGEGGTLVRRDTSTTTSTSPIQHESHEPYARESRRDSYHEPPREDYRLEAAYHRESEGCYVPAGGPLDGHAHFRYDVLVT